MLHVQASNTVWIGFYIALVNELLASEPQLLERMQQYQYVLVDEVQDNDRTQYGFVSAISELHKNVFFVGDMDQAIYMFRGADVCLPWTVCSLSFSICTHDCQLCGL